VPTGDPLDVTGAQDLIDTRDARRERALQRLAGADGRLSRGRFLGCEG
jgi:hypothetical protein